VTMPARYGDLRSEPRDSPGCKATLAVVKTER
jgi:hypothetical protein